MNEVTVGSMNLNDIEARFASTTCGGGKSGNDIPNTVKRERLRHRIVIGESQCARGHNICPASTTLRNGSVVLPRPVGAGLPTGMRQLHPRDTALLMNKTNDSSQR